MPLFTGRVYRGDTSQDRCQANSYPYIKQSTPSHRKGLFFTRRSLSCFTLGEFITLRVHSRRWIICISILRGAWKIKDGRSVGWIARTVFPLKTSLVWKSCTDQCEIYSLLRVVVWSQRHFPGLDVWWRSGPRGVLFCFFLSPSAFLFFSAVSSGCIGCWGCNAGIDWIIPVSSDSNVFYTDPLLP